MSAFYLNFSGTAKPRLTSQPPDGGQTTHTHSHTHFGSQQYGDERKAMLEVDTLTPCLPRFYLSLSITAFTVTRSLSLGVSISRSLFSLLCWCSEPIAIERDVKKQTKKGSTVIQIHNVYIC